MDVKDSKDPKDKDYFKLLQRDHPHLARFAHFDLPARFYNHNKVTRCDGVLCIKLIGPQEINIFITPGPEYKPLVLCYDCLQTEYRKVAGSGEYDIHERHLSQRPKK